MQTRQELYQTIDRPALQPLPLDPFVYAEWKKARVNLDYHIELGGHYYSTPYQLVGKEVDTRSTQGTVEIFCQGKRVASHVRSSKAHVASTNAAAPLSDWLPLTGSTNTVTNLSGLWQVTVANTAPRQFYRCVTTHPCP